MKVKSPVFALILLVATICADATGAADKLNTAYISTTPGSSSVLWVAKDADQALELLKAHRFDLVLTDVVMPGRLNGRALAEEVKQAWPDTRIVFMSGDSENALLRDGRLAWRRAG